MISWILLGRASKMVAIETSREEYFKELSRLGVKSRRRSELRSEYFRSLALIRWQPWRREELLARAREIRAAITVLEEDIAYERELISRKVIRPPPPKNKLVAMHKRWFYKSPRGTYHDISIEGVASIIIPGTERKEEYEDQLKDFLEDEMYKQEGFERLTELEEKVEGFEEKPTDRPVRPMRLETLEWWHAVFTFKQLSIEDFLRE
jgi:hypothetical protein